MKIAFIVGEFPSISETFILNQITGMCDLGHEITIFAEKGNFSERIHKDIIDYNLKRKTKYINIPSKRIIRILIACFLIITNLHKGPSKILKSLNFFKYGKEALSLNLLYKTVSLLDKNLDIIFCHFGSIGTTGGFLKEIGIKGKLVTMFHGADIRIEKRKGRIVYQSLFRYGDKLLVASDYNKKKLLQFYADPKKIILHPVGIDVKKFSVKSTNFLKDKSKIRIITVARLVEEKGLKYGIQAIKELLNNNPDINFEHYIIGGGNLEPSLRELVKKLGLNNVIHFLGPMTQENVILEMKKADIFLLPSIAESFGLVLIEAQAAGLPVVATKIGGIPEAIVDKKSGFLVPAKNIKIMAKKIEYLIRNPKIRLQMGTYGRKHIIKNYDINKLNKRLENIFTQMVIKKIEDC